MKPPERASRAPLRRLGEQQSFANYVRDVWRRREFIWTIAAGNLRSQHLDTTLGNLWHIVNPLLLLGVYYLVFGIIIDRASEDVPNFIGFLAVGIFLFNYCQRSISGGANSIVGNVGLIRSLQFPRAILPVSAVLQQLLAFGPGAAVMLVMLLATGEEPDLGWLILIPLVVVATLLSIGGALVAARLTDQVRDIQNVLPYIFRLLFYMSGILYSVDRLITDQRLKALFLLNPFYDLVGIARHFLMSTYDEPDVALMAVSLGTITVTTLSIGVVFFRRGEGKYGRG